MDYSGIAIVRWIAPRRHQDVVDPGRIQLDDRRDRLQRNRHSSLGSTRQDVDPGRIQLGDRSAGARLFTTRFLANFALQAAEVAWWVMPRLPSMSDGQLHRTEYNFRLTAVWGSTPPMLGSINESTSTN
jgi:hypothetical protein